MSRDRVLSGTFQSMLRISLGDDCGQGFVAVFGKDAADTGHACCGCPKSPRIMVVFVVVVVVVVVVVFLACRDFGRMFKHSFPAWAFIYFFFFF